MEKGSLPPKMECQGEKVLTSKTLASIYDCEPERISDNFQRNADRFKKGTHYFTLQNEEKGKVLIYWTKKGVFLHARLLNSDRGWQAYENLLDAYFAAKVVTLKDSPKLAS